MKRPIKNTYSIWNDTHFTYQTKTLSSTSRKPMWYRMHVREDRCVAVCCSVLQCVAVSQTYVISHACKRRPYNERLWKRAWKGDQHFGRDFCVCMWKNVCVFFVCACVWMCFLCVHVYQCVCVCVRACVCVSVLICKGVYKEDTPREGTMGWLRLVGSLKLQVSFAKEPYKRDDILQKRPIILRSLLIVATP